MHNSWARARLLPLCSPVSAYERRQERCCSPKQACFGGSERVWQDEGGTSRRVLAEAPDALSPLAPAFSTSPDTCPRRAELAEHVEGGEPVKGGALGLTRERRKRSPAAVPRRCQDEDDVSRASDSAVEGRSGTRRGTGTAESARGHKRGGSRQRQRPLVRVGVIRALLSLVLTV